MTADRDRVARDNARAEYKGHGGYTVIADEAFNAGWQAAADALAPPPVLDREAVARAIIDVIPSTERDRAREAADAILALLPAAPPPTGLRRVRHVKRGTTYTVLGDAEAQIARPELKNAFGNARLLSEGDVLTVYQGEDGKLWARFPDEMWDGRFEPIADAPAPSAPPPVPEDVRQARDAYIAAPRESDEFGVAREHYFLTASNWIRTLLATPAPPADTGDGGAAGAPAPGPYELALLGEAGSRLARKLAAERDTLTRRVSELEEALRDVLAIPEVAKNFEYLDKQIGSATAPGKALLRARAIIGGSHE